LSIGTSIQMGVIQMSLFGHRLVIVGRLIYMSSDDEFSAFGNALCAESGLLC
jgi:hypothetical protein